MSIEDPRLSSIDNTSAADDFDSAVEQHLGFASETIEGIEVAQAETPDVGRTDRLPAQQPVQTAAATIPTEVTANDQNVVTLPAGIELDNLEFEVDGENLVLVLADGTEITVIGGAANIPTFVVGDVELPQVALFAALEESNINVAAGPDGTFSAQSTPAASRNFNDDPIDAGPEDLALADLLGDTSFGDELRAGIVLGADASDTVPTFFGAAAGLVDEDFLEDGNFNDGANGNFSFRGSLGINWGADNANDLGNTGLTLANDRGVAFTPATLSALAAQGYTSDGVPLVYELSANDTVLTAFKDSDEGEGEAVFTVSVSDIATNGTYTFTLLGNLDHPDGQSENNIAIQFPFTAQDSDGSRASSSFSVTVNDDSPTISAPTFEDGNPIYGVVEEEQDSVFGKGNEDTRGEYDEDYYDRGSNEQRSLGDRPGKGGFVDETTNVAKGSLGISWGADDSDDESITEGPGNRSVSFAEFDAPEGLSSAGIQVEYSLSDDGTVLTATAGEATVFTVTLSDDGSGSYTFTLLRPLDHADGAGENSLKLDFQFTAKDSDGDTTGPATISVVVVDDVPVLSGCDLVFTIDEDDIKTALSAGTSPNDGRSKDDSYTGDPDDGNDSGPAYIQGSLTSLVKPGADGPVSFSFVTGEAAIAALETLTELGLSSKGDELSYRIIGNALEAYVAGGEGGPERGVFTLTLQPGGSFEFELFDQLDHDAPGDDYRGRHEPDADENVDLQDGLEGADVTDINFGALIQATDGDEDSISLDGVFSIKVRDDVPVLSGTKENRIIDEDDISTLVEGSDWGSLGTSPNDGALDDKSYTGSPLNNDTGPAFISGSLAGLIKGGADDTVKFSFIDEDALRQSLRSYGMSSNGDVLSYDLQGNVLYGFANVEGPNGVIYDEGRDRPVFKLTLNEDGSYTFELLDQLDHDAPLSGAVENTGLRGSDASSINFGAVIKATDDDGDSVSLNGAFSIAVTDDVPVLSNHAPIVVKIDEDGLPGNKDNNRPGEENGGGEASASAPAGTLSALFNFGSDGAHASQAISLKAATDVELEGWTSKSEPISISTSITVDGTKLVGMADGQVVFELLVNVDGSYTFTLKQQIDHDSLDGGTGDNTENLKSLDLSAFIIGKDGDGDTIALSEGKFVIDIRDDISVQTDEVETISLEAPQPTETTAGQVANFVLVLDTSGSVTINVLKTQVVEFLNQVAESGAQDVRVHIVEFADRGSSIGTFDLISGGVIQTGDLSDALTAIGGLNAQGDTNFEAGLQKAMEWIDGVDTVEVTGRVGNEFDANSASGSSNRDYTSIIGNGSTQVALVSGWQSSGTDLINANGSVNGGWGPAVGTSDSDVNPGQMLRFDFGAFNDFDGDSGVYYDAGNFGGIPVLSATFKLDDNRNGSNGTNFGYKIYFVGGGFQNDNVNVDNDATYLTLTGTGAYAGKQIAYVEFTIASGNGQGDIDLQTVTTPVTTSDAPLLNADINKVIFIADGDPNRAFGENGEPEQVGAGTAIVRSGDEITAIETDSDATGPQQPFTIEAYGLNVGQSELGRLDDVEGPNGEADNLNGAATLAEALKDVIDGLRGTTTTTPGQSVSGDFDLSKLVAVGADEALEFSFKDVTSGLPSEIDGIELDYSFPNGVLTAKAGNDIVFTLSLSENGTGTFTLFQPLGLSDVNIDFSSVIQAEDHDGDAIGLTAGKFVVTVVAPNVAPNTPVDSDNALNSVAEGASNGAEVGITATSTDVNSDTITYSLADDAGGRFAINAVTGVVTVANGSLLNYESASLHTIKIKASDPSGAFSEETFTIGVSNVAPVEPMDSNVTANSVAEGAANGSLVGLTASSSDVNGGDITYTLSDNAGGRFAINASTGVVTVADGTKLDFESAASHQITVRASDGKNFSEETFTIAVQDGVDKQNGTSGKDTLNGTNGPDILDGGGDKDILNGGNGNDILLGGAGEDTLTGGAGSDQFRFASNSGTDKVMDYIDGTDKIGFLDVGSNGSGSVNFQWTAGSTAGNVLDSRDFKTADSISEMSGTYDSVVVRISEAMKTGDIQSQKNAWWWVSEATNTYILVFNETTGRGEIWFDTNWAGPNDREKIATLDNVRSLEDLNKITAADIVVYNNATDPIILDLDKNGFAFSSIGDGVTFDIDADGNKDQIAWTSDDGILAYDVDGNGLIDNGSEIFTPDFNGGKFASGVAALASLDSNGDGKIDANDDAFSKLQVWVDADNDGVSDEGELSSLSANGVASISLTTDQTGGEEDGQTIFAEGEFTFADGSTGNFLEVGFDTIFGSENDGLTLHGGMGEVVMTGGAGNDTFVFDATALDELDVADVITDFNGDGDVLDVTALLDSLLGEQASAETAASHLRATVDDGNTTLSVQTGADTWKDVVVLQNHDTAIKVLFDDKHAVVTPHD